MWKVLAASLMMVAIVLFVFASRSSNLEWYVTEPIDSHGRRVHVLVPSRYEPDRNVRPAGREWLQLSDPNHTLTLTLIPNPSPPNTSLVRDWLKKLRLVPKDEPGRTVTLRVSRNALEFRLPDEHLTADG